MHELTCKSLRILRSSSALVWHTFSPIVVKHLQKRNRKHKSFGCFVSA